MSLQRLVEPPVTPVANPRRIALAALVACVALGAVLLASGQIADSRSAASAADETAAPDTTTVIIAEPEPLAPNTAHAQAFASAVNQLRTEADTPELTTNAVLSDAAQLWADQLAAEGLLRHAPDVRDGAPEGWTKIGENVGSGDTIDEVMQAFLDSPGHRENLYDSDHTTMGIGVATDSSGRIWTVQRFASFE